jgi:hypothetical protein
MEFARGDGTVTTLVIVVDVVAVVLIVELSTRGTVTSGGRDTKGEEVTEVEISVVDDDGVFSDCLRGDAMLDSISNSSCRTLGGAGVLVLRVERVPMRSGAESDGLRLVETRFSLC